MSAEDHVDEHGGQDFGSQLSGNRLSGQTTASNQGLTVPAACLVSAPRTDSDVDMVKRSAGTRSTDAEPQGESHSTDLSGDRSSEEGPDSEIFSLLGLTAADCRFLLTACTIIVLLIAIHLTGSIWNRPAGLVLIRPEEHRFDYQVEINQAGWVEWMQLPGIGETMARTIVADRAEHGPFQQLDDLKRVRGIGSVKFERIRPYLKLAEPQSAPEQPAHR